ncbi:MAG: hypothetical protein ACSHX9_03390 [Luteolibacter sp.]
MIKPQRLMYSFLLFAFLAPNLSAEWDIENPKAEVPEQLEGNIFGADFELGTAEWDKLAIIIRSKKMAGYRSESELFIFVKQDDERDEWIITPAEPGEKVPHVHMKFAKEGQNHPGILMFMSEYCMRLKLIEKTEQKATFQIHISFPDYKKSHLIGSFEAEIK